ASSALIMHSWRPDLGGRMSGQGFPRRTPLHQHVLHDGSRDIRQSKITALRTERELCVINAQRPKDRGVQIVDMHRILRDVVAEVVGLAVRNAALHAAAGHPDAEGSAVMVAAKVAFQRSLRERSAAELR